MASKSVLFNTEWKDIKTNVMDTFQKQLQEYTSSVNNAPNYGLDTRLATMMKSLHTKTDKLVE
jgi:hypothetical protein